MINLFKIQIFYKKEKVKLTELEVVGSTKEEMENLDWYKIRAMRNAGYDINTDKWDVSKFRFEATLLKNLDTEIKLNF